MLSIHSTYDSAFPFLIVYWKGVKPHVHAKIIWMFTVVLFAVALNWKQPKCPSIDDHINKFYIDAMDIQQEKGMKYWYIQIICVNLEIIMQVNEARQK